MSNVNQQEHQQPEPLQDKVVSISRVAKVVKGGRRFSFSALVVVGNGKDRVGYGVGKAAEVPDAIRKGSEQAKKNLFYIPKIEGTIPYDVLGKFGSSKVIMNPGKKGNGIIAGGAVRTIVELAGISDIVCKVHGTKNPHNVVRAVFDGFEQLMLIQDYARFRDKEPEQVLQQKATEDSEKDNKADKKSKAGKKNKE